MLAGVAKMLQAILCASRTFLPVTGATSFAIIFNRTAAYHAVSTLGRLLASVREMKIPLGRRASGRIGVPQHWACRVDSPARRWSAARNARIPPFMKPRQRGRNRLVVAETAFEEGHSMLSKKAQSLHSGGRTIRILLVR